MTFFASENADETERRLFYSGVRMKVFDKLGALLSALPRALSSREEVDTLLEIAGRRRTPRLVLLTANDEDERLLLRGLFEVEGEPLTIREFESEGAASSPWSVVEIRGEKLALLKLRPRSAAPGQFRAASDHGSADAIVAFADVRAEASIRQTILELLNVGDAGEVSPASLVLFYEGGSGAANDIRQGLEARKAIKESFSSIGYSVYRVFVRAEGDVRAAHGGLEAFALLSDALVELTEVRIRLILCRELPRARKAREELSDRMIDAFSAIAGAVALTPIPLADAAIITPLQGLMVTLVGYVSGRPLNRKTMAEAFASLGVVAAAGFGFRLVARQAVKVVPGAGSAAAAAIALNGTKALGKAAKLYFLGGAAEKKAGRAIARLRSENTQGSDTDTSLNGKR